MGNLEPITTMKKPAAALLAVRLRPGQVDGLRRLPPSLADQHSLLLLTEQAPASDALDEPWALTDEAPGDTPDAARVYLQAPVEAGCDTLLRYTAEAMLASQSLPEAMMNFSECLADRLGWLPTGARLGAPIDGGPLAEAARALDAAVLLRPRTGPQQVALPLARDGLAVFELPDGSAPAEAIAMAEPLTDQLRVLALRATHPATLGRVHAELDPAVVLEELTRSLSHELSQPLAAALNYAGTLKRKAAAEAEQRLTERLLAQLGRAREYLQDLREHLLPAAPPEPVDLRRLINARLPRLAARGRLEVVIAPALPPVFVARVSVARLLDALLDLAPDCLRGDCLPLRVWADNGFVLLAVSGERDAPADAARRHIDEPFYRAHEDILGMRLAVSRALAEAHGGGLWVDVDGAGRLALVLRLPCESA